MSKIALREGENILGEAKVDYWKDGFLGYSQINGKFYITNQRISFIDTGLIFKDVLNFDIELKDLESYKKCCVGPKFPFLPIGIMFKTKDGKKYRLGFTRRKKILEILDGLSL